MSHNHKTLAKLHIIKGKRLCRMVIRLLKCKTQEERAALEGGAR